MDASNSPQLYNYSALVMFYNKYALLGMSSTPPKLWSDFPFRYPLSLLTERDKLKIGHFPLTTPIPEMLLNHARRLLNNTFMGALQVNPDVVPYMVDYNSRAHHTTLVFDFVETYKTAFTNPSYQLLIDLPCAIISAINRIMFWNQGKNRIDTKKCGFKFFDVSKFCGRFDEEAKGNGTDGVFRPCFYSIGAMFSDSEPGFIKREKETGQVFMNQFENATEYWKSVDKMIKETNESANFLH